MSYINELKVVWYNALRCLYILDTLLSFLERTN